MEKIIFVYNADSGILNGIKDLLHKNLSPKTYACRLCAVTYDNFGMIREWKEFIRTLKTPVEFLHRNELEDKYAITDVPLPAAFIHYKGEDPKLWLNAEMMNSCNTLEDLKQLVKNKTDS